MRPLSAYATPLPAISTPLAAAGATAVLALMVTAVVALLGVGGKPSGASLAGYPEYAHGLRLQYVQDLGVDAVIADPADPEVLYVMVPHDDARGACSVLDPNPRVSGQTDRSVSIELAGYEYLPSGTGEVGFSCYLGKRIGVPVRLAAPLGNREVLGGSHLLHSAPGPSVPVLDPGDLPKPARIPAGYRAGATTPISVAAGQLLASRQYDHGADRLVVASGPASDLDAAPTDHGTAVTVDRHPARVVDQPGERCVVWATGAGTGQSVCSLAQRLLSPAQLLAVADSLHP